jgi:ABC-type uncharacterized transport system involved in gliding motility auxiliary subunit
MFGLILLGFGILGGLTGGAWNSLYVLVHLIGGTSMLALFLFTHVENLRESVTGRRTQYATNTAVYTLLTLAVVVMVNFMGVRNPFRYDATEQGIFSTAPQTVALLDGLDEDVRVIAFFRENEGLAAERLLEGYAAASGRFTFEMVDPDKRPEMAQQYEITQYGTLVAELGAESTRITELSEEALTNALIRLAGAEAKRYYFTSGHGEPDLEARETPDGLGQLESALENEGAEVLPLLLATVPDVPADAALLVVAGPQRPFLESEVATLQRYLDRGGRAWFLIEPRQSIELLPLLADRGIVLGDDVIIDQVVQLFAGPSVGVEPVVNDYGFHPITQEFRQNTLFRMARSVQPAEELPTGVTVTELALTSSNSWAETNLDLLFESGEVDPEGDDPGPVSLAVAATLAASVLEWTTPAIDTAPGTSGDPGEGTDTAAAATDPDPAPTTDPDPAPATDTPPADLEGRLVVVGDVEWVNNSRLTLMFNEDLALSMVGWLTGGADESISIRPRARRASRISLTEAQGWGVFYATVLLLPELVLLCGLAIWWRRRR